MKMNHIVIVLILALQLIIQVQSQTTSAVLPVTCEDASDCTDQGECIDGFCSCYSGFGGPACADKPLSACENVYSGLSAHAARFKPEVGVSFDSATVKMIIKAPLESTMYENPADDHALVASNQVYSLDTVIRFVGNNDNGTNECDYPNLSIGNVYSWTKASATDVNDNSDKDCADIYELNLPWSLFRSSCNIEKMNTNVFGQAIEISRNYAVPFESDYLTRTESLRRNIEFRFPDSVDISSNVGVSAPSNLTVSAVLSVKYSIATDKWRIVIVTESIRPFRLIDPSASTDNVTADRIDTVSLVAGQTATRQDIVIEVESCEPINAVFTVDLIAECYIGSECEPENEREVSVTATIMTGNACPLVHTISLSTFTMSAFSSPALTQAQGVFDSNSLAYFLTDIESDEATITAKTLQSVCISLNSGPCNNVSFTLLDNNVDDNPAFSITLSSLNGLAQDGDIVTVNVRVGIEWADTAKRSIQQFDVALNSRLLMREKKNDKNDVIVQTPNSGISNKYSVMTVLVSFLFCFIAFF